MNRTFTLSKNHLSQRGAVRLKSLSLLIALCILAIYAIGIEPYWVQTNHYEIHAAVTAPIKIAHLSDLHTRGMGRRERKVIEILNAELPDLIVITGDTLASWSGGYGKCREFYQQLHAPLGVWFVRGNWENERPLRHERGFYDRAGVHLLVNENQRIRPDLYLVGIDDPSTGNPNLDAALNGVPPGAFTILLFHAPGIFDRIGGRVNLCLAGHTHGGQVRLPLLTRFWLPGACGRFLAGWYENNGSRMYVSRGIGMSVLPVRLRSRPEVAFITLKP